MNATTSTTRFVYALSASSLLVVFAVVADVQAGPISAGQLPTISVNLEGENPATWDYAPPLDSFDPLTDKGGYKLDSARAFDVHNNRTHVEIQDLQFDPDPFVLNNILVTNNTLVTQIFSVFVGLPTSFGAPNLIKGNVRTDVIDGGNDGATVATSPVQPIYEAQIDGVGVASLQNHPFSVVAPAGMSNSAAAAFGPSFNAVLVVGNIGIQLRFTLTAGDTASILSRFDVVPEPTALGLSAIALLLAGGATRRMWLR